MSQRRLPDNFPTPDEYFDFLDSSSVTEAAKHLSAEEGGQTFASLLGLPRPSPKGKGEYLKSVQAHKVYAWLRSYPTFKSARASIEKNTVRIKGWNKSNDWEFRFSNIVAEHLWLYEFRKFHGVTPKFPDSATRLKAANYAKQLLALIKHRGVALSSHIDQAALARHLATLQQELRQTKARPRNDDTLLERLTVQSFCQSMQAYFGAISPAIVADFASMIGYETEQLEVQINAVRKSIADAKRAASRKALVNALMAYPRKSSG